MRLKVIEQERLQVTAEDVMTQCVASTHQAQHTCADTTHCQTRHRQLNSGIMPAA